MVSIPAETPETIPVEPTVAMPVLLLLQVPPLKESVRVTGEPIHTAEDPCIDGRKETNEAALTVSLQLDALV